MEGRLWSKQEDEFLHKCYGSRSSASLAKQLNRAPASVRTRAHRLGITIRDPKAQKKLEAYITEHYSTEEPQKIADRFDVTLTRVYQAASRMGVKRPQSKHCVRTPAPPTESSSDLLALHKPRCDALSSMPAPGEL